MSQPTNNTNGILISTPAAIPTPSVNNTYFFNSSDNNKLYYKTPAGTSLIASAVSCDPCLCDMAAKTMCAWNEGLLDGTLTQVQYLALINAKVTFTCSNGVDTISESITVTP